MIRLIAAFLVVLTIHSLAARAQDEPVGPVTPVPSVTPTNQESRPKPDSVEVSGLDTIYLRRENGDLVPYIDIPFEVFDRIYDQLTGGGGDELPQAFTIERLEGTGNIQLDGNRELATFSIRVVVAPHRSGWVSVPLNLVGTTLVDWEATEDKERVLIVDGSDGGYVAWIKGGEENSVSFTVNVAQKVVRQGSQSSVQLGLPSATLTQLTLDLPLEEPEVELGGERLIPRVESLPGGRSRLTVTGPVGNSPIRWRPRADEAASGLSVATDITVQIDGPDLVRYQATLDVVSLNGRDRRFLVKLPRGARFDAPDQLEIEVDALEAGDPELEGLPSDSRYVRVSFPQPLSKPTRVVLFASRSGVPMEEPTTSTQVAAGGFEVLGAVRQSGSILLIGSRDWRVDWNAGSFLRQVSLLPTDREREGAVARFQFSRAPIELTAKIVRNESRSACEPLLDISFWRDRMQMDVEFHYSFSGPRPEYLLIDSRGWELDADQLSSQRFVRRVASDSANPQLWRLDLDPGLAEESLVLAFSLTRPMDRFGELQIPLPSPVASTVSAAILSLRSTEDLEVLPRLSAVQGTIVPRPAQLPGARNLGVESGGPSLAQGPQRANAIDRTTAQDTLEQWLRIQSLSDVPELNCRVTVRPQRIDVTSRVKAQVDGPSAQVTQTLDYNVRYVPFTGGLLAVQRSIVESGQLELRIDGQIVLPRPETNDIEAVDPNWELIRFELPRPVTGSLKLEATFSLPIEQPEQGDETIEGQIPLIVPLQTPDDRSRAWRSGVLRADGLLAIQPIGDLAREVEFEVAADRIVVSSDDSWRAEDQGLSGDKRRYLFTKVDRDAARSVPFGLAFGAVGEAEVPRVVAAWVQTLCAPEYRRDRVTLRVASSRPTIDITLPPFVRLGTVAVDGVEQRGLAEQVVGRKLTINFPNTLLREEHTIELWYRFPRNRAFDRSIELELPRLDQVEWIDQAYWEVVLPPDEYVIVHPLGMVSENRTDWHWWGWNETPRLSTADLEDRLQVPRQTAIDGVYRRQLYSTFGESAEDQVWIARRWEVLFFGSGLLFVIGMLAVLVKLHRRPIAAMLGCAIAFAVSATVQPAGQWLAQLALLVSCFIVFGAYLQWLWARPARRLVTRPATAVDRSATRNREPDSHRSHPKRIMSGTETAAALPAEEVRA